MDAAVLADDTTGALEMGALLAGARIRATVSLDPGAEADGAAVFDLSTRHISPLEAAGRVARTARSASAEWLYHKTDSTLRGNIAAELSALRSVHPERAVVYVPAYPQLGRTVVGGRLLVDGVPVTETAFARDTRSPVREASVLTLLAGAGAVHAPDPDTAAALLEPGALLVCDASTDDDLARIADVLRQSRQPFIAAGPGGFARHWCGLLPLPRVAPPELPRARRWMLVCGSLHAASRRQALRAASRGLPVECSPANECMRPEEAAALLAREASQAVSSGSAGGLILFGGDTARAVLRALGCSHLTPHGEVLPGVPASVAHLPDRNLPVVTKAGGFGGDDIVERILQRVGIPA